MIVLVTLAVLSALGAIITIGKFDKTRGGKTAAIICIILTLGFTTWSIIKSNGEAEDAKEAQIQKAFIDSTNYSNDTIQRNEETKYQAKTQHLVDSIRNLQIELFKNQLSTGYSIDNIKSKTLSVIGNLDIIGAKTNELVNNQKRQFFPLDNSVSISLQFGFKNDVEGPARIIMDSLINEYFIKHEGLGRVGYLAEDFPYFSFFEYFLNSARIEVTLSKIAKLNFKDEDLLFLSNPSNTTLSLISNLPLHVEPLFLGRTDEDYGPDTNPIEGNFKVFYNDTTKEFRFDCPKIPLQISPSTQKYPSILDYDSSTVLAQLVSYRYRTGIKTYKWDSTFINFQLNFSDKKHSFFL